MLSLRPLAGRGHQWLGEGSASCSPGHLEATPLAKVLSALAAPASPVGIDSLGPAAGLTSVGLPAHPLTHCFSYRATWLGGPSSGRTSGCWPTLQCWSCLSWTGSCL